jgi:hypothetical protein
MDYLPYLLSLKAQLFRLIIKMNKLSLLKDTIKKVLILDIHKLITIFKANNE